MTMDNGMDNPRDCEYYRQAYKRERARVRELELMLDTANIQLVNNDLPPINGMNDVYLT